MCDPRAVENIKVWAAENEAQRKVIMEVVKSRLNRGWPYNFKALDLLGVMPVSELAGLADKLKALTESPATTEGSAELKKLAKPLFDKAMVEVRKAEEEEARKKQEAITAMWGGLWANHVGRPAQINTGWDGYTYPWGQIPPGVSASVSAPAQVQWTGQGPEGWQSWVLVPRATPNPTWGWPMP